jgi:hypothetical protein
MKKMISKKKARPVAAGTPVAKVSGSAPKSRETKVSESAADAPKPAPVAAAPVRASGVALEAGVAERILKDIAALRELLAPKPVASGDAAIESSVDSLRRLLTELIESRLEGVAVKVAAVRLLASTVRADPRLLELIDGLMTELGAVRFEAQRLDYVDPLIHRITAERSDASAPDGVVLETLQPGFRTARGLVAAKAEVTVNRRS